MTVSAFDERIRRAIKVLTNLLNLVNKVEKEKDPEKLLAIHTNVKRNATYLVDKLPKVYGYVSLKPLVENVAENVGKILDGKIDKIPEKIRTKLLAKISSLKHRLDEDPLASPSDTDRECQDS